MSCLRVQESFSSACFCSSLLSFTQLQGWNYRLPFKQQNCHGKMINHLQQGPTCTQAAAIDFAVFRTYQHNCQFLQSHHSSFMSPPCAGGLRRWPRDSQRSFNPKLEQQSKTNFRKENYYSVYSQWKENNPINSLACIENMNKALLQKHFKLCYIIDFMFMTALVHYFPSLSLFIRFDS